jgi:hypothetical protein
LKALLFSWHLHHHIGKSNQHELGNLNWQNQTRNNIMVFINSWKGRFKTYWVFSQNMRKIIQVS